MTKARGAKQTWTVLLASIAAIVIIGATFLYIEFIPASHKAEAASAQIPITGWLWSDMIGWISANCSNTFTCKTNNYGLYINADTGIMSGYGWSDSVGWVSANDGSQANPNDLAGCPTAPCTAIVSGATVTGWLKALSANGAQTGGWDGWISLNGSGYGVTYSSGGAFGGYAWGSADVGWVSFALASSTYNTCAATAGSVSTCQGAPPTQTIHTVITDASCNQTTIDTTCTAPAFCSVGLSTCQVPPATPFPSGSTSGNLTAKPSLVPKNATTTLYWGIVNVQIGTCAVTGTDGTAWSGPFSATSSCPTKFSSGGATGCQTNPITGPTTFTLTCKAFDGSTYQQTATVNILPDFQER